MEAPKINMDNRKISLAIYTHQKYYALLTSFEQVLRDDRVAEILIIDDFSDEEFYYQIEQWLEFDAPQKIKLAQNIKHIGEELSQHTAMILADNEYALLTNSESVVTKEIIDEIFRKQWDENMHLSFGKSGLFLNRGEYIKNFKTETK